MESAGPALNTTTSQASGWYTFEITADYDKVDTDNFITLTVKDSSGQTLATQTMPAATMNATDGDMLDSAIKAIRLVKTTATVYAADMQITTD